MSHDASFVGYCKVCGEFKTLLPSYFCLECYLDFQVNSSDYSEEAKE